MRSGIGCLGGGRGSKRGGGGHEKGQGPRKYMYCHGENHTTQLRSSR